jgi:hypothetical protein
LLADGANGSITGACSIGGNSCDTTVGPIYNDTTNFKGSFLVSAVVPSGTTAGASIHFSAGNYSGCNAGMGFYTVDNTTLINPTTPTTNGVLAGAVSSITGNVATSSGSSVLLIGGAIGGSASGATISASDAGLSQTASFGTTIQGLANGAAASAASHATISWTGTSGTAGNTMISYR